MNNMNTVNTVNTDRTLPKKFNFVTDAKDITYTAEVDEDCENVKVSWSNELDYRCDVVSNNIKSGYWIITKKPFNNKVNPDFDTPESKDSYQMIRSFIKNHSTAILCIVEGGVEIVIDEDMFYFSRVVKDADLRDVLTSLEVLLSHNPTSGSNNG